MGSGAYTCEVGPGDCRDCLPFTQPFIRLLPSLNSPQAHPSSRKSSLIYPYSPSLHRLRILLEVPVPPEPLWVPLVTLLPHPCEGPGLSCPHILSVAQPRRGAQGIHCVGGSPQSQALELGLQENSMSLSACSPASFPVPPAPTRVFTAGLVLPQRPSHCSLLLLQRKIDGFHISLGIGICHCPSWGWLIA